MTRLEKTKFIINNLGVRQQFIADNIGLSKSSFSEYVNGKRGLKEITVKKLEMLFNNYNIVQ